MRAVKLLVLELERTTPRHTHIPRRYCVIRRVLNTVFFLSSPSGRTDVYSGRLLCTKHSSVTMRVYTHLKYTIWSRREKLENKRRMRNTSSTQLLEPDDSSNTQQGRILYNKKRVFVYFFYVKTQRDKKTRNFRKGNTLHNCKLVIRKTRFSIVLIICMYTLKRITLKQRIINTYLYIKYIIGTMWGKQKYVGMFRHDCRWYFN